ncbi:hypothetical protein Gpo141_00009751 [Globisporangium polare]
MARFVEAAMRPGSREFVIVLNCVLAALFFVMLAVVYTQLEDSIHVAVDTSSPAGKLKQDAAKTARGKTD